MCEIVEEYVSKVLAERLIFYTENAVKALGNLEAACDILGIEISDYMKAKELLQKNGIVFQKRVGVKASSFFAGRRDTIKKLVDPAGILKYNDYKVICLL